MIAEITGVFITFGLVFFFCLSLIKERRKRKRIESENKYDVGVKCKNCLEYNYFIIEKGKTIKEFLQDKVCFYCGVTLEVFSNE